MMNTSRLRSRGAAVRWTVLCAALVVVTAAPLDAELLTFPARPADRGLAELARAIEAIHARAVRSRGEWTEADLQKRVPKKLLDLDSRIRDGNAAAEARALALAHLALLWADIAWIERVRPIEEAVAALDAGIAARLGHHDASEHFVVRVVGAERRYARAALDLAEAARAGYEKLFGLRAISKVPGKKVRILICVDPELEKDRLYFHPSPPYHSELRLMVPDPKLLTRAGGRRLVYGFCHELGHMIAMWGEHGGVEDDRHAWAHYTGCLIVEEVYDRLGNEPWPTWTAFQRRASGRARLEKQIEGRKPGLDSYESILALFHAIGAELGTEIYGRAWEVLEKKRRFRLVNRVRYLWMRDLEAALMAVAPREKRGRVMEIFRGR